jgi:hypothetical protein
MNNNLKTINVPKFFYLLPKEIQDLVFEFNIEHRFLMKNVLNQLKNYIFCENCNKLIAPSLLNKVRYCSSVCLYNLLDIYNNKL